MESERTFILPGSGYEVLSKILHAYLLCGEKPAGLDDVASKAGMDRTVVSRNHGFLMGLGLVTSGKNKSLTDQGKKVALAISHNLQEDEASSWRKVILDTPKTMDILNILKVQGVTPKDKFIALIAQSLGEPDSATMRTRVNTLIEILLKTGLVVESDGNCSLDNRLFSSQPPDKTPPHLMSAVDTAKRPESNTSSEPKARNASIPRTNMFPIHVNIELHLPASSEKSVYDALFKSIRENLLDHDNG
jgi:hypothetical protein